MEPGKIKKEVFDWIKSIAIALVAVLIIKTFIMGNTQVIGQSMEPTLKENDRIFTNIALYLVSEPKRGDIVVMESPDEPEKDYIKRVVALKGDIVELVEGNVFLNGEKLIENYIDPGIYTDAMYEKQWVVKEGEVFVLGDNRNFGASKDSRYFGTIPVDSIKGKASLRYFPFGRAGFLKSE